eukprot:7319621-Pyramimonas_sp.AAC.1
MGRGHRLRRGIVEGRVGARILGDRPSAALSYQVVDHIMVGPASVPFELGWLILRRLRLLRHALLHLQGPLLLHLRD